MKVTKLLTKVLSYVLVAALASYVTFAFTVGSGTYVSKLEQLEYLITERFVGEADTTRMNDAAAAAMVNSLGDRWSYYIPADQYADYVAQMENAYVGIGVTIEPEETTGGFLILQVEPSGGAKAAGILPGDVIVAVDGQRVTDLGVDAAKNKVRGEEGSTVELTVLRDGAEQTFSVIRQMIQVAVATGQMLENQIGFVQITNFDERCAQETLFEIEELLAQGAKALIFDVRFNPGGYKTELVEILDYLLPEGDLFISRSYTGKQTVDTSDADCLEMPMAVLINAESYSAAEFFAAALEEYDWAVTVGEPTVGKGNFQNTFQLKDGSAVGLSVGKYFTPKGVSLSEVGGLKPQIEAPVDGETAANIYAGLIDPMEDPQVQAAIQALQE